MAEIKPSSFKHAAMLHNEVVFRLSYDVPGQKVVHVETLSKPDYKKNSQEILISPGIHCCISPKQFINKKEIADILQNKKSVWFEIPETGLNKATKYGSEEKETTGWDIISAIVHYNYRKPKSHHKFECWVILDVDVFGIILFSEGKLRFYNFFDQASTENILYFVNACCQNSGMDFNHTAVYLTGDKPSEELIESLTMYCGKPKMEFAAFKTHNQSYPGWFHWINHVLLCV